MLRCHCKHLIKMLVRAAAVRARLSSVGRVILCPVRMQKQLSYADLPQTDEKCSFGSKPLFCFSAGSLSIMIQLKRCHVYLL